MQNEYWINVYPSGIGARRHSSAVKSIVYMFFDGNQYLNEMPIYRIHVKMKNVKPKYEYGKIHDSWFLY